MNRPRNKQNKDLPPNLYADRRGRITYYAYKHPATGKRHGMGANRTQAILAAKQLNTMLSAELCLVDRVLGGTNTLTLWIKKYLTIREAENIAPDTVRSLKVNLKAIDAHLGTLPIADLSVFHVAEFLNKWTSEGKMTTAKHLRSTLIKCLDYAISNGLIDDNVASKTLPITAQVKRHRLTKEQFDAIYKQAPIHVRNAMMLGLLTLQRREDIVNMQFTDIRDGYLHVVQSKTAKARKGKRADSQNVSAHLRIEVTEQLAAVIQSCRSTRIVSKYLVHQIRTQRFGGAKSGEIRKGEQLDADVITRGFRNARDKAGLFDKIPSRERPSFHEIRALGAHLYREQGINPQALLGHTSEKMTALYLDGHGEEWTVVQANLQV
jgi:integrase